MVNQKFDEEPRYEAYMKLFEPLCGPGPNRPIITEGAIKARRGAREAWVVRAEMDVGGSISVAPRRPVARTAIPHLLPPSHHHARTPLPQVMVGQKRGRDAGDDALDDASLPKKKASGHLADLDLGEV